MGTRTNNDCAFAECLRPVWSKALCNGHYQQHRQGKELKPLRDTRVPNRFCTVVGCREVMAGRGLCNTHLSARNKEINYVYKHPRRCVITGCAGKWFKSLLCRRHYNRASKYKLSPLQLDMLLLNDLCEMCGEHSANMHVDHDHACCNARGTEGTCGRCFRGWICQRCNSLLGRLETTPVEILNKALQYAGIVGHIDG